MKNEEIDFTDPKDLRLVAEKRVKEENNRIKNAVLDLDAKRLMHELQVHQIELEMQNEELQRANETAEAALKKYTMLYDFAPMGYFTLNSEGNICDLNFTGAELLGEKRFSLENINFKLFILDEYKLAFDNFFEKVFNNNTKETCQIRLGYNKSPLAFVYMEGIVLGNENKCLLSVIDISNFKNNTTNHTN